VLQPPSAHAGPATERTPGTRLHQGSGCPCRPYREANVLNAANDRLAQIAANLLRLEAHQQRSEVRRTCRRQQQVVEPAKAGTLRAHLDALPAAIAERLSARGLEGSLRIIFEEPAPAGAEIAPLIQREK
jgi:hypothetical protein